MSLPADDAPREIELKLLTTPEGLRRIAAWPALDRWARGPAETRDLRTVYYDTPGFDLMRGGIALRVRTDDSGRTVQTVKTRTSDATGAATDRAEWEWELSSPEPDLTLLSAIGAAHLIPEGVAPAPLFATEVERVSLMLHPAPGTRIELCLDGGAVVAGNARHPLAEVELELKDGAPGELYALALELLSVTDLSLGTESKAEVGYRLCGARTPSAMPWQPPSDAKDMDRSVLATLLANHAAAVAGDAAAMEAIRAALRHVAGGDALASEVEALRTPGYTAFVLDLSRTLASSGGG